MRTGPGSFPDGKDAVMNSPRATDLSMRTSRFFGTAIAMVALCIGLTGLCARAADDVLVIKGVSIHGRFDGGADIDKGIVVIRDGRIVAVGDMNLAVPSGAQVIEVEGGSITPGLIDANALLEPTDRISADTATAQRGRPREPLTLPSAVTLVRLAADAQAHQHDGSIAVDPMATPELTWVEPAEMEDGDSCCAGGECALGAAHAAMGEGNVCPVCGQVIMSGNDRLRYASGLAPGNSLVESSSEVVPHTLVIDSINFRSPDFDRLVRGGVTTVFAAPDSAAVIGPRGAVVRTAGPMKTRVMNDQSDALASFGSDSFRFGGGNQTPFGAYVTSRTRRPNSRMGVAWVFRKAFYDAEKAAAGQPITGADQAPPEAFETLTEIRNGQVPLRIKARLQRDIETALRLSSEFDLKFTLVEATEAYKCLSVITESRVPVIFGPIYTDPTGVRAYSEETRESRLSTVKMLMDAGVETALTAMDLREEDGLSRQAMYAMRAGVTFDQALKAVTLTPAKMLGVDKEVGSIEVGKRGDVVVWSGQPFDAASRPVAVVMDGKVVYDAR